MPSNNSLLKFKKYVSSPENDWVVFVHGIGGNSRTFSLQLKALKPHFNLLFPDLRGHGLSRDMPIPEAGEYSLDLIANDVFKLLDNLNIKKAHFIGGSFGAILIRIMEEMQPKRFISVVMSGAVLRLKTSIYLVFKSGKMLASYINNHFLYKTMAYFIMPRKNHAQSRQVFIDQAKLIDPREYKLWLVILEQVKAKLDVVFYEPFQSPALIIMGNQDHAFLKDSIKYCRLNQGHQLEIIKHCGHLSNIEKYKIFNQSTLQFLTKHSQQTACIETEEIAEVRTS